MAKLRPLEILVCPFANLPEVRSGRWGEGLTAEKMKDCVWVRPELDAGKAFAACEVRGLEGRDGDAGAGATRLTEYRPPRMGMFSNKGLFFAKSMPVVI